MLFFIDESWHHLPNGNKVGVLAAVQIKAHDFNQMSTEIHKLKVRNIGYPSGNAEIKGKAIFRDYVFRLESEKNITSSELNLARDIFKYAESIGVKAFASVVFSKEEMPLNCADQNHLDRPFFFLFERINLFMEENYPGLMAKIIFDDRGVEDNCRISAAISNFFHKSQTGQQFNHIIKVPTFGISNNNIGIQLADMVAYLLGKRHTKLSMIREFDSAVKRLEFKSREKFKIGEKEYPLFGFKTIRDKKEKEVGDC